MTVKRGLVNLDYTQDKDPGWSGIESGLGYREGNKLLRKGQERLQNI